MAAFLHDESSTGGIEFHIHENVDGLLRQSLRLRLPHLQADCDELERCQAILSANAYAPKEGRVQTFKTNREVELILLHWNDETIPSLKHGLD